MAISSELPVFLRERVRFTDHSSTLQDIQVGAQMAQQAREEQRLNRAQQLNEEAKRMAMDEKERIAAGAVEVTRVLSEMGQTGGYTDPALQSKFWDAVSRNPKFAASPAFKDILDTFQYAEQAKARAQLETTRQDAIGERNQASITSRFDLLSQRLDGMLQMEGVRQDGRKAIEELKNDLNMLRDSLKPTRVGALVHDLPEADLVAMRSELGALDTMYEKGKLKGQGGLFSSDPKITPEQEYETRRNTILKKYDAKRIGTPKPADTPSATVPPAEQRQVGTVYQTPKGPFKWNGTGWEAP